MKHKTEHGRKPKPKKFRDTLPREYAWKIFNWLRQDLDQFLQPEEQKVLEAICRERDIPSLLALEEEWGLQCMPTAGADLAEKQAKYQLAALLKKFLFPTNQQERMLSAVKSFLEGENACEAYNLEGHKRLTVAEEPWEVNAFTYARSFLQKLLGLSLPDPDVLTKRSRHGPGATTDTVNNRVSSYFKFEAWPYHVTAAAFSYARRLINRDKRWLGALEDDYRTRYDIPKWRILNRQVFWNSVLTVVEGNRITFVPKNAKTMRSIAIEPSMNLMLQLGVDGFIRRRLKRWGVDLDHQEKNQWMAYLGSVQREDPFVTIDLKNASNSVALKLCEVLLPEDWYDYLVAIRSPKGFSDFGVIDYQMISSMGNGYTFALESALFTAVIYGVLKALGLPINRSEFAVFGDDIIVRQSVSEKVIRMLANCGFVINVSKSFLSGPVRESCGTDWLDGAAVRPVFLEDIPKDVTGLFSDRNRLKRILELRWGIKESKTVEGLERWIPENYRKFVGPYSDIAFDSYLHSCLPTVTQQCVRQTRCVYEYETVVHQPLWLEAPKLHFRKLMHDLSFVQEYHRWDPDIKLKAAGGRFGVYRRYAGTLGTSVSIAELWQSEYNEYQPKVGTF